MLGLTGGGAGNIIYEKTIVGLYTRVTFSINRVIVILRAILKDIVLVDIAGRYIDIVSGSINIVNGGTVIANRGTVIVSGRGYRRGGITNNFAYDKRRYY